MKPLAVFAMPKDRNKVLSAEATGNRGSKKGVKKTEKGTKKRAPKSPSCHERTVKSSFGGKLWIGLHATFAQIGTFILLLFRDAQPHH